VGGDVLTCDVGDELLEPIPFPIQDQTDLAPLVTGAEASGTDKEPKLEWHVEAGQLIDGIELRPGGNSVAYVTLIRKHIEIALSRALSRATRLAESQHERAGANMPAGGAFQGYQGELHKGQLAVLADEPIDRQDALMAA
jgi:hypothetical protein